MPWDSVQMANLNLQLKKAKNEVDIGSTLVWTVIEDIWAWSSGSVASGNGVSLEFVLGMIFENPLGVGCNFRKDCQHDVGHDSQINRKSIVCT